MTEVDPDPAEDQGSSVLGDRTVPGDGDPTDGGKHGEIGSVPSIEADEPDEAGSGYPVGGGSVVEEQNAPPVADPGV